MKKNQNPLSADVTMRDVLQTLAKPEAYLRGAFEKLHEAKRTHGDVRLRIGTSGAVKIPHYRIDKDSDEADQAPTPVAAFDGRNHKPLLPTVGQTDVLREELWSTEGATYAEVQALLGELRNYKAPVNARAG